MKNKLRGILLALAMTLGVAGAVQAIEVASAEPASALVGCSYSYANVPYYIGYGGAYVFGGNAYCSYGSGVILYQTCIEYWTGSSWAVYWGGCVNSDAFNPTPTATITTGNACIDIRTRIDLGGSGYYSSGTYSMC